MYYWVDLQSVQEFGCVATYSAAIGLPYRAKAWQPASVVDAAYRIGHAYMTARTDILKLYIINRPQNAHNAKCWQGC